MNCVLPYLLTLKGLRSFLEQQRVVPGEYPFPNNWCEVTSELVRRVVGLELKEGSYVRPKPEGYHWDYERHCGDSVSHCWNYDPQRGLYVDLTQDQFGYTREKVIVLKESTPLLDADICNHSLDSKTEKEARILEEAYLGWEL